MTVAAAVASAPLVAQAQPEPQPEQKAQPALRPPVLIRRVDPEYPPGESTDRPHDVTLHVLVDVEGHVTEVTVAASGGEAYDAAAIKAVKQWVFRPGLRNGKPVAGRIHVPLHFAPAPQAEQGTGSNHPEHLETTEVVTTHPPPDPRQAPHLQQPAPTGEGGAAGEAGGAGESAVFIYGHQASPSRGSGDYDISIGALRLVPRGNAGELLKLAPGVFLTNEGGSGHPNQVFLRGFDARIGQDIEFTLNGVPFNEVGNVHGNGLADSNFIIPELVESLRIIEGPFDPHQGNFAVAGSADYRLGLARRGLIAQASVGSYGARRLLLLWGPQGQSPHTFGGVEVFKTDGFGQNRQSERATAMGSFEGRLGQASTYRVLATSYATHYGQAGVLRVDDLKAGRVGFYDTYDAQQSGDASRHSLALQLEGKRGRTLFFQDAYLTLRGFRQRHDFTGFLEDTQLRSQSPHGQRGDLIDQQSSTTTLGARGGARADTLVGGRRQELELGYSARLDRVASTQRRDRAGTNVPYRTELDLESSISNLALYADASLRPLPFVTLRGGGRVDSFHYDVDNRCALTSQQSIGGEAPDTECFTQDRAGYRSASQRSTTQAAIFQPRATLLVGPFAGFMLSLSQGYGSRSYDPQYVAQDYATPFARVRSTEGGVAYLVSGESLDFTARSTFFQTHVDHDLFFNQTEGRNTLAGGTTRTGWAGTARLTGSFFDVAANMTLVRATFDDTHLLIPYVPDTVVRGDGALWSDLPLKLGGKAFRGTASTGVSFVGQRPLPFDERSNKIFTIDAATSLGWGPYQLGLSASNVLDNKYRLAEYNYVSDFRSASYATRVPARHFVAGEPRVFLLTFTLHLEDFGS
jgi:iron complex outermembrane recepter protein